MSRKLDNLRTSLNKRRVIAIAVLLVILLGVSGYYLIVKQGGLMNHKVEQPMSIQSNAEDIATKQGAEAAQTYLDNAIKNTSDLKQKSELYLEKSTIADSYGGNNDNTSAINFARQAEDISSTPESALMIAVLEEERNNVSEAIKYYKLYLDRLSKIKNTIPENENDYDYYAGRLKELEARQ